MNCPNCHQPIKDAVVLSAAASIVGARAKSPGRPKKKTPCPRCGAKCPSAVEARKHCVGRPKPIE